MALDLRRLLHHYCVPPTSRDQCLAIQDRVRPYEVAYLWRPLQLWQVTRDHSIGGEVARFLASHLETGALRYFPDPPGCDVWRPPSVTLQIGGGDCDDFAILSASMLVAGGLDEVDVVIGNHCDGRRCAGHAWVEGVDEQGWFHLEATNGVLRRDGRPLAYKADRLLRPGRCSAA